MYTKARNRGLPLLADVADRVRREVQSACRVRTFRCETAPGKERGAVLRVPGIGMGMAWLGP